MMLSYAIIAAMQLSYLFINFILRKSTTYRNSLDVDIYVFIQYMNLSVSNRFLTTYLSQTVFNMSHLFYFYYSLH